VTIEGSPPDPNLQPINIDEGPKTNQCSTVLDDVDSRKPLSSPIPSASTLVHPHAVSALPPTDYFGNAKLPPPDVGLQVLRNDKPREAVSAPATSAQVVFHPDDESITLQPKRISLTRQSSSPLPVTTSPEAGSRLLGGRVLNEKKSSKTGWAAKFEQSFSTLGYLLPPSPPDELERRRALHKYAYVVYDL
jgi:hypothetical protein